MTRHPHCSSRGFDAVSSDRVSTCPIASTGVAKWRCKKISVGKRQSLRPQRRPIFQMAYRSASLRTSRRIRSTGNPGYVKHARTGSQTSHRPAFRTFFLQSVIRRTRIAEKRSQEQGWPERSTSLHSPTRRTDPFLQGFISKHIPYLVVRHDH